MAHRREADQRAATGRPGGSRKAGRYANYRYIANRASEADRQDQAPHGGNQRRPDESPEPDHLVVGAAGRLETHDQRRTGSW